MLRQFISALAMRRAHRLTARSEAMTDRRADLRDRAFIWTHVETWLSGLLTFEEFRESIRFHRASMRRRRKNRAKRQARALIRRSAFP